MNEQHKINVAVQNKLGLHTRAATLLVQLASSYPCEVFIGKDGQEVNGKSIMGILMLVAGMGTEISVRCEGSKCEEACLAIVNLVNSKFGEGE